MKKITIIGAGAVGTTTAYALMLNNTPASIALVDIQSDRCHGEVVDLNDSQFQTITQVHQETIQEASNADIIVIAAGERQKIGQTRDELLDVNHQIVCDIIRQLKPIKKDAILLMVSNPLDTLARCALQISELPENQVIGTGTFLDSKRLQNLLSQELHIAPNSIHAYVLGEHGDTQFAAFSSAQVGGVPLLDLFKSNEDKLHAFAKKTKEQAYEIIACKGATYYGIAACVSAICNMIISNAHQVVPLSTYIPEHDIYCSVPVVLGAQGIVKRLPLSLNEKEQAHFKHSIHEMQKLWKKYC